MSKRLEFVDPKSGTTVGWDIGNGPFRVKFKTALGKLVNEIAMKTHKHPLEVMTSEDSQDFYILVKDES